MFYRSFDNQNRFGGFFVPFILGGLVGGAAVGVSRPRPVFVNPPMYGPPNTGYVPVPYYPLYYY